MIDSTTAVTPPVSPTVAITGLEEPVSDRSGAASPSAGQLTVRQRYLYAFAPQQELIQMLKTQASEEHAARRDEILAAWNVAQRRASSLSVREVGLADRSSLEAVPHEYHEIVRSYTEDPLFQQAFSLPNQVALVDIDTIVAAQRTVNLDYTETIRASLPEQPSILDHLRLCVSPARHVEPTHHLEQAGAHVFGAPSADFRFLGSYVRPACPIDFPHAGGGCPTMAIVAFVGFGAAPVNAFLVGSRLVLNNGFHRLYALRASGVSTVPVVVQRVTNPLVEMPPVVAGVPREYLLGVPRPVLMKDFFDEELVITLNVKKRIRTVTLGLNVNQFDVPV